MSDGNCQSDVVEPPCAKKIKKDEQNENGAIESKLELKDFVPTKIINNSTNRKTVCILGNFKDKSGVALILLEKNAFKEEDLNNNGYFSAESELKTFFQNDIYGNFECYPKISINGKTKFITIFFQINELSNLKVFDMIVQFVIRVLQFKVIFVFMSKIFILGFAH